MTTAYRKFTSAECLAELMKRANDTPSLIRDHIRIFTDDQNHQLVNVLWPAVFQEEAWYRTATKRPGKEPEDPNNPSPNAMSFGGGWHSGTDREIRTYENEVWADYGRGLIAVVTTEFGEIADVQFQVNWN